MSALTTRLGLYKPGGGLQGTNLPDEQADIDKLNDNFDDIDAAIGFFICTSTTRPPSPFDGQAIYETDTQQFRVYRQSITDWVTDASSRGTGTLYVAGSLSALDALLVSASLGDGATISAASTGINRPLWTRGSTTWQIYTLVTSTSKANMDAYIALVAATANCRFLPGQLWLDTTTNITYRFTSAVGAYVIDKPMMAPPSATAAGTNFTFDPQTGIARFAAATGACTLDLVFEDGYDYQLEIKGIHSTVASLSAVLRTAAPADDVNAVYDIANMAANNSTVTHAYSLAQTSWAISAASSVVSDITIDLTNPREASTTYGKQLAGATQNPMTAGIAAGTSQKMMMHRNATAFAGLKITISGGTFTGIARVIKKPR